MCGLINVTGVGSTSVLIKTSGDRVVINTETSTQQPTVFMFLTDQTAVF